MKRLIGQDIIENDDFDTTLRPKIIKEFVGQDNIKEMIEVYIKASLTRNEPLDHVMLYGPPGLGKTTLANIIANELKANIRIISAPSIEKIGDLATILSSIEDNDIIFIDEIHRLSKQCEEFLYSAMEDFRFDIMVGKDNTSKSISIDLPKFTLIGATTRYGEISSPLRDRFGITLKMQYYSNEELSLLVKRTSKVLGTPILEDACTELSKRSRATPRIANRLFKRVRDFALVKEKEQIDLEVTRYALNRLSIDDNGLDQTDYKYLKCLLDTYNGGPVGLETLSVSIAEDVKTVEDVYEPYLIQQGFISRSPRGRIATKKTHDYNFILDKEY